MRVGAPPWWLAVVAGAALGGCSVLRAPIDLGEVAPDATRLDDVPFFAQTEYQCGPAALAGVLGSSDVEVTPEELRSQVYLPERRGSLQVELLGAARRAGRIPYVIDRTPEALLAEIGAGRPVLVMQNLRVPRFPIWHYAVVVGHEPEGNRILLNSGKRQGHAERAPRFLRRWDWARRWGMVVLAPGELPVSGDARRYAEAVAAFEPVGGSERAEIAWRAALERWPDDVRARLALGNAAHASGRDELAVQLYREGLAREPQHPVLANNLASVLGELGCPRAGELVLGSIASEMPADSPWRESISATKNELAARGGDDPARCVGLGERSEERRGR